MRAKRLTNIINKRDIFNERKELRNLIFIRNLIILSLMISSYF